jgi:hypothetical protein
MRALVSLLALLSASACAAPSKVYEARMPLEVRRAEGQAPRMGDVALRAGGDSKGDPFSFTLRFDSDGEHLGSPHSVGWTVKFGDYCRDRPSWVQSVLIGPNGQAWPGWRVFVPAGLDRGQDWSTGYASVNEADAVAAPGLLEALKKGGRFKIALEDDEGRYWHEAVIDLQSPSRWEQLFAANRVAVGAADPDMPLRGATPLIAVYQPPFTPPPLPRPCP